MGLTCLWQLESHVEFTASDFDDAWQFFNIVRNPNITVSNRKRDPDSHLTSRSACIFLPHLVYIPELGSTRSEHKETTPASGEEGWWSRGALGTLMVPGFRAGLHTEAQKLTGTTLNRGNEYRRSVSWLGPAWEGWEVCGTTQGFQWAATRRLLALKGSC